MDTIRNYSFEEILVKYLNQDKISLEVKFWGEEEDISAFKVSFINEGVVYNHLTFIPTYFLNDLVYLTGYNKAINYLRDQPILIMLVETIVFKVMVIATKEERRAVLDKYDDLENDLFLDESLFFTLRYILKQLIEDRK